VTREGAASWRGVARAVGGIFALLLLLLCLIPPTGVLSDNEEDYFQLAAHSVAPATVPPDTAVFDASPHRAASEFLLGHLIAAVGFEHAQMIARAGAALLYAVTLWLLFRAFALGALDSVLVVTLFALMGQTLFGGEWLFSGFEAKVLAYILVALGLALTIGGRNYLVIALVFAFATYFHFLVGGFWFAAAMLLRLCEGRPAVARVAGACAVFALAVAPLVAVIAEMRWSAPAVAAIDGATPDMIYSLIRAPHHAQPFVDGADFIAQWLPGYLLAGAMLAAALFMRRTADRARGRAVALWLALLFLYLFAALVVSAFDRDSGHLGKFYLFRPASLLLLLWLAAAVGFVGALAPRHMREVKALALALTLPALLLAAGHRIAGDVAGRGVWAKEKRGLAAFLARTPQHGLVLIDPALEFSFLDFERMSGHPMLVAWKFDPTNDPDLEEWYRRIEFRKALFDQGCGASPAYPVAFLLATPEHAAKLAPSCGKPLYATDRLALIPRGG
jgi:hypothetical protein